MRVSTMGGGKVLRTLKLYLYLTLSMFSLTRTASADCPTDCYCDDITSTTTCIGDRRLSILPQLDAQSQSLRRLEIRDYILPLLIIEEREQRLFFESVQELSLSFNQIQEIQFLDTEQLLNGTGLPLKLLDLSTNNLTEFISLREMGGLTVLDLSHNRIQILSLEWLGKLESLNLRSNSIEELSEEVFQPLRSLHYINLDSNRLTRLSPNLFANLPALAHLIISANPLRLDPGFLFNSRTQFIDVSHVGLTSVPPSLSTTVRDLRLNDNKLKWIQETDFESYPNVGLLVLDENQIEKIEDDALGRLEFLTGLWLNGNKLSRIPQNLPASLKSLQLEENLITTLNQSDFLPLRNLETLNLHGNGLSSLEPLVFAPLIRLRTLVLRSNSIEVIYKESFNNLTALEILDLSQNPLKVIVNGAFSPLSHLSVLHLARLVEKDISLDVGVFSGLSRVQILDLCDSKYLTQRLVSEQGLGAFKALRELNLERCELPDSKLLCDQLSELTQLRVVKGAGNGFSNGSRDGANAWMASTFTFSRLCPETPGSSGILQERTESEKVSLTLTTPVSTSQSQHLARNEASTTSGHETAAPDKSTSKMLEPTSTSSYFEDRVSQTNEDVRLKAAAEAQDRDEQQQREPGSIDGFPPPDLSAQQHQSQPQTQHHHDFAKGSFNRLPQKMLLRAASSTDRRAATAESGDSNGNLILKTVLISAGSCMFSLLVLLAVGLTLYRVHGGRFRFRTRRTVEKSESYTRLEDKQELELGIRNKMYYEDGQVFHIS